RAQANDETQRRNGAATLAQILQRQRPAQNLPRHFPMVVNRSAFSTTTSALQTLCWPASFCHGAFQCCGRTSAACSMEPEAPAIHRSCLKSPNRAQPVATALLQLAMVVNRSA